MALNVDKIKKTNTVSTPVTTSTDTSTRTNKKPIDFNYKNGDKTETDNPIITSINSKECKALKNEAEKIEWVRQNNPSLKGASNKDIKNYISLAQQIDEKHATGNTKVESHLDSTKDEAKDPKLKAVEEKLLAYKNNINPELNLDEIIENLENKALNNELNDTEKALLKEYNTALKSQEDTPKDTPQKGNLFNMDELLAPQYTKLKPEQKYQKLAETFLKANDKTYSTLSDNVKDLMTLSGYNPKKKTSNLSQLNALALLQYAHTQNKSISDLKSMDKRALLKITTEATNEIINSALTKIKNMPGKNSLEKVNLFAESILQSTDPEYAKLSGDKKIEYRKQKIEEFFNNMGLPVDKISKDMRLGKSELFENFIELCSNLAENGQLINILQTFNNGTELDKLSAQIQIFEAIPEHLSSRFEESIELSKTRLNILKELGENATEAQILEHLEKKSNRTKTEEFMLKALKNAKTEFNIDLSKDSLGHFIPTEALAALAGISTEEYINSLKTADLHTKEGKKLFDSLYKSAILTGNGEQIEQLVNILKERGFSEDEINHFIEKSRQFLAASFAAAKDDGKSYSRIACCSGSGTSELISYKSSKMLSVAAFSKAGEQLITDSKLRTAMEQGINDLKDRAKANQCAFSIANNSNIADSYKSQFTKELIVDAKRLGTEEQLRYAKTLSQVNNPAVTEGLAAASKSVDSSARQQYDSYVDNAMKNYTPEQQAAIRQARETGEISSSTLAQTNTSNGKPIENSTSNSGSSSNTSSNTSGSANSAGQGTGSASAQSSANNAAGSNTAQASGGSANAPASSKPASSANQSGINTANQTSRSASANKIVSNSNSRSSVSASVSDSSASPISSSKTQTSNSPSVVDADDSEVATESKTTLPTISPEETQKLKEEAQVLMDRIEEFIETQAESIQAYEEEQAKKLEARFEDIVAELTGETEVYLDPNISKYENLPQELKNDIKEYFQDLYEKNGINAIYNALDGNKKDSFVERLASTKSHEAIMAFANEHRSDRGIIKTLFKYSQNIELIRFMNSDDIIDLYMKGQIQDINLIKNNSEALAKIIELQLKGGEEPKNLKGLYALLTAEYQSDILANYPTLAEEIPGTDAHYAKHIQSMKTAPSANPNPAIAATNPDSGMIILDNEIPAEHENPYIYDKGDGHSVTLPFGRDYDRQKKKGHIYFA